MDLANVSERALTPCWEAHSVDEIVQAIRRVELEVGWQRVLRIDSALSRLESSSPEGRCSLREVANHPKCDLSKSQLHEIRLAARAYAAEQLLRESRWLSPSHAVVVASLPPIERKRLLLSAEMERLSVRQLRELARRVRRSRGERRGRPTGSGGRKAITRYDNAVLQLEEALELVAAESIDPALQKEMERRLEKIRYLYEEGWRSISQG